MFDLAQIFENNTTSAQRTTAKKQALNSNKDYIQIAIRNQRGKQYLNAVKYTSKNVKGTQLNKKQALAIMIDYCNNKLLPNTVYSVDDSLVKQFKDYLNNK